MTEYDCKECHLFLNSDMSEHEKFVYCSYKKCMEHHKTKEKQRIMKEYKFKDHNLKTEHTATLITMIDDEADEQIHKWGYQSETLFEWMAWTTEEYGEYIKAINEFVYRKGSMEEVIDEGIQTITLILKTLESILQLTTPQEKE